VTLRSRSVHAFACAWLLNSSCNDQPEAAEPLEPPVCATVATDCSQPLASYEPQIAQLVERRCNGVDCHSHDNQAGIWPLDTYEELTEWSSTVLAVIEDCSMPPAESPPLSIAEKQALSAWLACDVPQ